MGGRGVRSFRDGRRHPVPEQGDPAGRQVSRAALEQGQGGHVGHPPAGADRERGVSGRRQGDLVAEIPRRRTLGQFAAVRIHQAQVQAGVPVVVDPGRFAGKQLDEQPTRRGEAGELGRVEGGDAGAGAVPVLVGDRVGSGHVRDGLQHPASLGSVVDLQWRGRGRQHGAQGAHSAQRHPRQQRARPWQGRDTEPGRREVRGHGRFPLRGGMPLHATCDGPREGFVLTPP